MSTNNREWERGPPIRSWAGEHFNHEDREIYDVELAVSLINRKPDDFQFIVLPIDRIRAQVEGRGSVDLQYAAALTNEDAVRPVLLGRYADGSARLLDGYHRATRLLRTNVPHVGAWLLTVEQTKAIRVYVPIAHLPANARVNPTSQ
ncbi:hypothetical protein AN652_01735 [Xanthomonas arboricola pv. pruni]|uniref:ParB/Sulfiredoxin domain-containing protein n=1 Tax=Xanthomonas arboricola pv. pruni MAFF 301420 TaxID=1418095 RepID=W4SFK2_9XANT|nr:hypothetical protein DK27_23030 [Xanthomonas arboricola pv. pruni]KPN12205.1 hypothetical protein AN652_01735 [Xanthomonas arboricola pv. pruni]OEH49107.1 hypothetical protein XapnCFBP3894_20180 [Xanthomonas arboricola pv. pruni]GAE55172.1 hypothetical protein XPR_1807 [Xanthomonas arboricola pv. pruni MAFF 301420]GAE59284.1 hypothetical protein XPN_1190 [Xanthomonas arboricola pv. pruni MAFF 301427]